MALSEPHLRDALAIIDGLLVAIENWAEVSATVYGSEDRQDARQKLAEPPLSLSPIQVEHVLDMSVAHRTEHSRRQLIDERDRLRQAISELGS